MYGCKSWSSCLYLTQGSLRMRQTRLVLLFLLIFIGVMLIYLVRLLEHRECGCWTTQTSEARNVCVLASVSTNVYAVYKTTTKLNGRWRRGITLGLTGCGLQHLTCARLSIVRNCFVQCRDECCSRYRRRIGHMFEPRLLRNVW